jgi:hypothetical protein
MMFTFQHGFWLYFFSRRHPQVWQFVVGSMLPDYVYFVLLAILMAKGQLAPLEVLNLSPTTFMTYLPQYPWAMQVDLMGHSAVFWVGAFALTMIPRFSKGQAFVIGWGTHIFIDGITHAAHANFFLYPLTMLVVHSPISYWEPTYFAREFKLVNGTLIGLVAVYLVHHWWKKRRKGD